MPSPASAAWPAPAGAQRPLAADWDLYLLLALMLGDVRLFQGSSVASFTLYELYVWGYCTPFVIGSVLGDWRALAPPRAPLVPHVAAYVGWLLLASVFALVFHGHSDVLQDAKNIVPALPLACFLAIRLRRVESVCRLANLYTFACLLACALAVLQVTSGGPYLRPAIENNDYKLDLGGSLVSNLALGFSGTPNEMGLTVLPGLMFCVVKLVQEARERTAPRLLTLACTAGCAVALVLAESRGALVWFCFGATFVLAPIRRRTPFWLKLGLVALVITGLVAYALNAPPSGDPDVENTIAARLQLWRLTVEALVDNPYTALLGDGGAYILSGSWQAAGWEFPDAHNGWLDQALFFGLPALLLYLGVWRRFFAEMEAVGHEGPLQARALADGLRGTVIAYMGLYFFEPVAHSVPAVGVLFLVLSCGISVAANMKPLTDEFPQHGAHLLLPSA